MFQRCSTRSSAAPVHKSRSAYSHASNGDCTRGDLRSMQVV
jgi:hypothetical protein